MSSAGGTKTSKTYNLAASADWELDIFGKLTNAKRGAKAVLEQSEAYRQAVQTQLVATIANSYYTLLMLDKQLDITHRTAETWDENLRAMKALKKPDKRLRWLSPKRKQPNSRQMLPYFLLNSRSVSWKTLFPHCSV